MAAPCSSTANAIPEAISAIRPIMFTHFLDCRAGFLRSQLKPGNLLADFAGAFLELQKFLRYPGEALDCPRYRHSYFQLLGKFDSPIRKAAIGSMVLCRIME